MILEKLNQNEANFADVIAHIEENYLYTASAFVNGNQENAVDQNQDRKSVV